MEDGKQLCISETLQEEHLIEWSEGRRTCVNTCADWLSNPDTYGR